MKTKNKKKRIAPAFKSFYPVLIMILCLFMGVGYAAVNSVNLTIAGDIIAMELDDVVVTDISYKESSYATLDSSNVSVVSKTVLNSNISLSSTNSNSYITYTVTVLNTNTYDCFYNGAVFDSEFYDNQNIVFELSDNMIEGMFLKAGESLSFDIKFKYKDGVTPNSSINKLNAYINVDFPAVAVLQATAPDDRTTFRTQAYRENIKIINFEDKINVPSNVVDSWDIGVSQTGNVMAYLVTNESDSNYYDLYIQSDTKLYANEDMGSWFRDFQNVDAINGLDVLDTSNTIDMQYMFNYTGFNSTIFTLDVSGFDTSNVTNMKYMFCKTGANSTVFTLDISNFDTSNVTDMSRMFYYTGDLSTTFELDVSNFDTSKVTDMAKMFHHTGSTSPIFSLDVSNFDTSKVTTMLEMFYGTGYSNSNFKLDVSNFDTSNVIDMSGMFYNVGRKSTEFSLDVSNFDTSKVTDMSYMFYYVGYTDKSFILDISNFDTSNVIDMSGMFYRTGYNSTIFNVDLSSLDTSKVTNTYRMFYNTGYNSTKFNTSFTIRNPNITSYEEMFLNAAPTTGSKITVNYTSETSDLVDKMIATKSEASNVVKGTLVT